MPQVSAGFRDYAIDRIVIAGRVVMRQGKPFDPCRATHRHCVLNGAMPPADLLWVLLGSVLGVMDDEVRAGEKLAMPQVFAADFACSIGKMPVMRLVIGCINDRCTLDLKPVSKR